MVQKVKNYLHVLGSIDEVQDIEGCIDPQEVEGNL